MLNHLSCLKTLEYQYYTHLYTSLLENKEFIMFFKLKTCDDKELISSKGSYYKKKNDGFNYKKTSSLLTATLCEYIVNAS